MAMISIGAAIHLLAEEKPEAKAITCEGHSITRRELELRTNRLARAYAALGVAQDAFVTIALPNGIEFYEACVATWKLGATPQPVSAKLPAVERTRDHRARQAGARGRRRRRTSPVRRACPLASTPSARSPTRRCPTAPRPRWKAPTSGGSTGRPKLIVATQPGSTDPERDAHARSTQLVPGPLYHNAPFAFSMQGLFSGGHLVVMTRFDAEHALALIAQHTVQYAVLVPTMMHRIWRLAEAVRARYDVSSLQRILHLGAPCPAGSSRRSSSGSGPSACTSSTPAPRRRA